MNIVLTFHLEYSLITLLLMRATIVRGIIMYNVRTFRPDAQEAFAKAIAAGTFSERDAVNYMFMGLSSCGTYLVFKHVSTRRSLFCAANHLTKGMIKIGG